MLFILSNLSTAFAQDNPGPEQKMTLEEAWERVEKYNKSVKNWDLRVQISHQQQEDTRRERLPEIGVKSEYARISNLPMYEGGLLQAPTQYPVLHNFFQLKADAYLNLYEGHRQRTKEQTEEVVHALAEEQRRQAAADVRLRVAAVYLDLSRSLIFEQLTLKNMEEAEKRLAEIRELHRNGVVIRSDLLRAELQLSRQKMTLVEIRNAVELARQKLNLMIGLPEATRVVPADSEAAPLLTGDYEAYVSEAMGQAFALKIAGKQQEISELNLRQVQAGYKPRIGLFADYEYAYPQILFYPYAGALYGLGKAGLRISYPVSALYHTKHKEQAAKLEIQRQQIQLSDRQDAVRQEVREAYVHYREALERVEVSQLSTRQAEENYRIVRNTYFHQLALLTDLLDADSQLLQARFDLASARLSTRLHYYQLLNTIGK